ncbi:GNAT family N-acetyltransferase [Nocardioides sp. CFH 31398]|uniref:GNAT family N-acetyltransferase n=1 Tax=Nocardioides sp. CFH 31398 TaxID=2919579 RepID=UPI001F0593E5|nr:GNAT family N-acetyltransferase [Nocardioides sp. CFH 31398]MCH1869039.1 GNAT family N-acetyltransferase [Nocardioides sp. CFH 31398]
MLLHAELDGETVGVAELSWGTTEDLHLCDAEIHVRPDARRQGVGRALWEEVDRRRAALGREVVESELDVPATSGSDGGAAGPAFAQAMGFRTVHLEERMVLGLPVDPGHLAERATTAAAGYEVVSWVDRCPDDLVDAWCDLRTRMEHDVPTGDSAGTPITWDVARLRTSEERTARSYRALVFAARRTSDGQVAAYSLLFVPHEEQEPAVQDDTLVMPEHRGHRLGTLVKVANLEALEEVAPPRRAVHTWTAPDNGPMVAVNRAFGFVTVAQCHQVQWRAPAAG